MGESTRLEKILEVIYNQIRQSYNENEKDYNPEMCEELIELDDICFKLLHFDYFKNSENYLTNEVEKIKDDPTKFGKIRNRWEKLYKKDLKVKQKDLKKLFKSLIRCSEDL